MDVIFFVPERRLGLIGSKSRTRLRSSKQKPENKEDTRNVRYILFIKWSSKGFILRSK